MSISIKIPHSSRFFPTSTTFSAVFNVPVAGKYSFNTPLNTDVLITELQPNSVYLIERISVGGDITEEDYLASINTVPVLIFRKRRSREMVHERGIPIVQYFDGLETMIYIHSDKGTDALLGTFTGLLDQIANTVGHSPIRVNISMTIWQISENDFNKAFRDRVDSTFGNVIRK